jgi:hypothetical protein
MATKRIYEAAQGVLIRAVEGEVWFIPSDQLEAFRVHPPTRDFKTMAIPEEPDESSERMVPTRDFKTMAIPEEPDESSERMVPTRDFKTMAIPEEPDESVEAAPRQKSPFGDR